MKFVVAVVMLAVAIAGVQSSLLAAHYAPAVSYVTQHHAGAPWGAGYWGGPWGAGHGAWGAGHGAWGTGHGAWGHGGPAAVAIHASAGPWGHSGPAHWGGYPGISLSQGPHAAAAPLPYAHGHGHEGVYVAKTRGAVHTAPLAGHINSATSINVAPAPGTH